MSLITVDNYKEYKNITNTSKDDYYSVIVDSVNTLIKAYTGRTLTENYGTPLTHTETPAPGVDTLILKEIPINEISAATQAGENILGDLKVDKCHGFVSYAFDGESEVQITYTGGFPFTPPDIKLAALELVDYYVNDEHKKKRTMGGATIEYNEGGSEWPLHIQSILSTYRDV